MKKFEIKYSVVGEVEHIFNTFSEARKFAFAKAKEFKCIVLVNKLAFYKEELIKDSSVVVLNVNGTELY